MIKKRKDFIGRLKYKEDKKKYRDCPLVNGFGYTKHFRKWWDLYQVHPIDNVGYVYVINNVVRSTETVVNQLGYQRVGNKIVNKRALVTGYLRSIAPITPEIAHKQPDVVLVAMVYDRNFNGVKPSTGDILSQVQTNTAPFNSMSTDYMSVGWENPLNSERFCILKTKRFYLRDVQSTNVGSTETQFLDLYANRDSQSILSGNHFFEWDVDLDDMVTEFEYSGDITPTDDLITSGALLMVIVGVWTLDVPELQTQIAYAINTRIYYEDSN